MLRPAIQSLLAYCSILALLATVIVTALAGQGGNTQLCMTRNETIVGATLLYAADHNERLVPLQSQTELGCARQMYLARLLLPYHGDWLNYRCPQDTSIGNYLGQNACTGFATRAYTRDQQFATWSIIAHRGYNYMFLAPLANVGVISYPVNLSQIADPSSTIMYMDSVWDRNAAGVPYGGGTWGVDPPCIRNQNNQLLPPFPPGFTTYYSFGGWNVSQPLSGGVYGYAWPWHNEEFVGVMADGTARTFTLANLTAGCDVRSGNHSGQVTNMQAYLWDIYE
jgi:hypothetical protein